MEFSILKTIPAANGLFFRAKGSLLAVLLLVAMTGSLRAQINGVINFYSEVSTADFCNNRAIVTDNTGFSVGDRVLLIQMQGAVMDTTDTPSYGDISDFRQTGKYEFLTISDIDLNIFTFLEGMVNIYDGPGIQLIRIPTYTDVTVGGGPLTAQPWNGVTGGVLVLVSSVVPTW